MSAKTLFLTAISATVLILYITFKLLKQSHPLLKTVKSILSSTLFMIILNFANTLFGISIPLNVANLCAAGFLGIPGICLIIILNAVF